MTENSNATPNAAQSAPSSTLIEFPGVNRNRPAWRKELSERFREIQQRRARESTPDAEPAPRPEADDSASERAESPAAAAAPAAKAGESSKQPRLVPQPEPQELSPIVQAALRRVERARQQTTAPSARAGHGRAAAVARAVEEDLEPLVAEEPAGLVQPEKTPAPSKQAQPAERPEPQAKPDAQPPTQEASRPSALSVVLTRQPEQAAAPAPAPKAAPAAPKAPEETAAPASQAAKVPNRNRVEASAEARAESADRPKHRHISGVIDDFWLERHGSDALPKVEAHGASYDDRAPVLRRLSAAVVDFVAVAVLSVPGAAIIELTIGDWTDPRVLSSMGGIVAVVMFLYHTCSVALAGRTPGMRLFSLHAVDANTARVPTTGQCVRRAFFYIVSLAAFGLGLLYALFDAERRTAHDLLSGTVVVTE
jgi:uncharacterized RDD family membrane protein YckC